MDSKKLILIVGVVATIIIGVLLVVSMNSNSDSPSGQDGNNDNVNTPTGEPVTLEYWGLWEPEGVMLPLIEKYQQANPNVRIIYTQKSFEGYEGTLYTRLQQGASAQSPAPDIFRIDNRWLNKFQGYLNPLPSTIMDPAEYSATFYPTAVSDFTGTDSQIYAIPLEVDGLALFYNKELFAQASLSKPSGDWDSVIDEAKLLTIKDPSGNIDQAGLAIGSATNIKHSADILSLFLLQNGVEINQNYNTEVSLTTQRAIDALDFYTSFTNEHEVWSSDLRSDLEMFFQGKLAMMLAPSWRAFDIINANPAIEFGIVPAPTLPGDPVYFSMYWGEAVSATSENSTEAWKFIKFLSEQDQIREFHNNSISVGGRAFGEPYSRKDMGAELQSHAYLGAFMEMAPQMKAWKIGEQSYIEEQLRTAINDVAVNGTPSEVALLEAEESINAKLAQLFGL
ncbi:extracellular solute-binding protein [Candidatus Nomurabacteria bacterium]|nr:extracellular solute-binding protein [Candidatus Nomurabacteria bacterium]MCB9803774.1 extracellular solute-binding protein [Candidatus Nomurabacteria bacterium]